MKNGKYLPFLALFLGLVCAGARWTLFRNHTDALGLLETGTYAELCVWLLTGLCLVLFALAARRGWAWENKLAAPGQMLGGLGIFLTALGNSGQMAGPVASLWKIMGLLAGICLIVQGVCLSLIHISPSGGALPGKPSGQKPPAAAQTDVPAAQGEVVVEPDPEDTQQEKPVGERRVLWAQRPQKAVKQPQRRPQCQGAQKPPGRRFRCHRNSLRQPVCRGSS